MKPLLKWPGGKSRELDQVYGLIPEYDRYLEPFFGGGAMYFHLQPKAAAINDTARDLMEFYHMIRTQDPEFRSLITCYANSFKGLLEFGRSHVSALLLLFDDLMEGKEIADELSALMDSWMEDIMELFDQPIVLNEDAFRKELEESLMDKLERTVKNHRKQPFSPDDLLVLDDSKIGYDMATAAGVKIGFAAWSKVGFESVIDQMRNLCDFTFYTVADFEDFLFT